MYAKTLVRYAADRNGVFRRDDLNARRQALVMAVLEADDEQPWLVWGREDRPGAPGDRPHVMRVMVQRVTVPGLEAMDAEERRAAYEDVIHQTVLDPGAYFMEGGRELKAFLELRPFESKGEVVETDWHYAMSGYFTAYHARVEAAQAEIDAARDAVMAYSVGGDEPSEEDRVAVARYVPTEEESAVETEDEELRARLARYAQMAGDATEDGVEFLED
jgi:hypothetical protein